MTISHGQLQDLRARVRAMQRKIDRYKNYARIKYRKENKRIEQECKKNTDFFYSTATPPHPLTAQFIKTWRV